MLGIGVGNVAVNLIRIMFMATVARQSTSALVFYSLAAVFLIFCFTLAVNYLRALAEAEKDGSSDHRLNRTKVEDSIVAKKDLWARTREVYAVIYPSALTLALTFMIQMTFFPGVLLTHKLSFFRDFGWFAISLITAQNLFDTLGRYLASIVTLSWKQYLALCFSR